jgi:hypothetical protein
LAAVVGAFGLRREVIPSSVSAATNLIANMLIINYLLTDN